MSAVIADRPIATAATVVRAKVPHARLTWRRTATAVTTPLFVFLLASMLTFGLGALSPSNPGAAVLGETATPADITRMNHAFGLDRPLVVQYADWLAHAFTGDLGRSWFTTVPVSTSIRQALPVDLQISALALLFATVLGGAAGIVAARRVGSTIDRAITLVASALGTLPAFVTGIGLIVVFAVWWRLLPSGGYPGTAGVGWVRYALLPSLALSLDLAAGIARQLRTSLVTQLGEAYVTGLTARGLPSHRVLGHALRNAAGPALTVLGAGIPMLIGGAVVTERIFNLPGVAQLALQAASEHDVPVVQGTLLVIIGLVLLANTAVNAALALLTPHARNRADARSQA